MDNETFVSVIIPVYNAAETVGQCLEAVFKSDYKSFEVIAVDDNSTDNSKEIIDRFPCRLIKMKENLGPAAARNRGAQSSRGEILFFLDSDIIIEKNTINKLVETFHEKRSISAVFCSYQKNTAPKNFFSDYKNLLHHHTHQTAREEAATFCGGFGAIRKEVFLKFGGFDEKYRSLEDMEIGYRLYQAGHKIYLNKSIQLTHCKEYSLRSLLKSDLLNRAIPWTKLMLNKRIFRNDLNTKTRNVLSVPISFLILLNSVIIPFFPRSAYTLLFLVLSFLFLNNRFHSFVFKERGLIFTIKTVFMNWFFYIYSGLGSVIGTLSYLKDSYLTRTSR